MPIAQSVVGIQSVSDGATVTNRAGRSGELIASALHAKFYEAASRKSRFVGANQAAQALSAALATTYTGVVLSNPAGSGVNAVLDLVGFAPTVAPASIASLGLIGNFISTGLVTHTTPITPTCTFLDGNTTPRCDVDSAATLPNAPVWLANFASVFTTLSSTSNCVVDVGGMFIIPPGGYIAIGGLVAYTGLGFMAWEEVPV